MRRLPSSAAARSPDNRVIVLEGNAPLAHINEVLHVNHELATGTRTLSRDTSHEQNVVSFYLARVPALDRMARSHWPPIGMRQSCTEVVKIRVGKRWSKAVSTYTATIHGPSTKIRYGRKAAEQRWCSEWV